MGWVGGQGPLWGHPAHPRDQKTQSDPQIPLADMTFIHEGNRTMAENLINFEKMVSGAGWLPRDPPWGTFCVPVPWDADPEHPRGVRAESPHPSQDPRGSRSHR